MEPISGIILAGGSSSRLGQNKALIQVEGELLIERVVRKLRPLLAEIVVVIGESQTRTAPHDLPFLGLRTVPDALIRDTYQGIGTLGGLHAGLDAISTTYGLAVGCDMPFLNTDLIRYMISLAHGYDAVMPHVDGYFEPLHAVYARRCRHAFERAILGGQWRVLDACAGMRMRYVQGDEVARYDPDRLSFFNVNTPQDLAHMQAILARQAMAIL